MAQSASLSSTIAGRYAQAVFDIAQGDGALDALGREVDQLTETLDASDELRALLSSPAQSRETQGAVIGTIAERLGLGATLKNTLSLMAENRRLFALPALLSQLRTKIAEAKGEITAEVTTAQPLSDAQAERLSQILARKSGKTVKLDRRVDAGLIGGMVVRLGSTMIDSSIRSRLAALQNVMKEVG